MSDTDLCGLLAVVVDGSDHLVDGDHLAVVRRVFSVERVTAGVRHEATQRVVRVIVPDAVVVVARTHRSAALQLHQPARQNVKVLPEP